MRILVRQFRRPLPGPSTLPRDFLRYLLGTTDIVEGDCAVSEGAYGPWAVAGQESGGTLCYIDKPTGDAILYWTHDDEQILVKATNQRGDSAALYSYFTQIARFIAP